MSKKQPPPRARRETTLADVARLAGVSPMTASRALHQPHLVAPDTILRVRDAADALAYVPNLLAGGLRSRKSRLVTAVIPSTQNPVFVEMIQALRDELLGSGYQLMLGLSDYSASGEDELLDAIISRRPDGIVLTGVVHSPSLRRRLVGARIPVVETWDLTPTPIDMLVGFSNEKIGRAAAEYFIRRGSRKLALIVADDQRSLLRREGFVTVAAEHGLAVAGCVVVPAPSALGMGRNGLSRLLAAAPDIDAVFCSSDLLAMGVLFEAIARGILIPEKMAVMGFGNLNASADTYPALTTVAVDSTLIGRQVARLLLERVGEAEAPQPPRSPIIDVGFRIIARASA
ncbi:MAG: LacI family DNA-binding transcriptional regulator [Pseudomonadota bacterium]|nr:LacI family DNA-binding transcriptional regulator [Pseudomonadota bacterium]